MTILLNNVDTDITDPATVFVSRGGPAVINVRANNFGGATVEIQTATIQDALTRFTTLSSGSFTAASSVKLDYLPNGVTVRAIITGTTGPTDGVFVDILQ